MKPTWDRGAISSGRRRRTVSWSLVLAMTPPRASTSDCCCRKTPVPCLVRLRSWTSQHEDNSAERTDIVASGPERASGLDSGVAQGLFEQPCLETAVLTVPIAPPMGTSTHPRRAPRTLRVFPSAAAALIRRVQGLVVRETKVPHPDDPAAVAALRNLKERVQSGIQKYRGGGHHTDARRQRPAHSNDFARLARRCADIGGYRPAGSG
jgi:hypothetical protein